MPDKLKVENRPQGEKAMGIITEEDPTVWQQEFPLPNLFQCELMECLICKAKQQSNPKVESQWYCLQDTVTKNKVYLCPVCIKKSESIQKAMNHLLPTRMVLFQGESAREFPLDIEELKKLLQKKSLY